MDSKKLIKKLQDLSKEKLILIANNYNIYDSDKLDKKELIDLIIMNETGHIPKKNIRHKKYKKSKMLESVLLGNIMFISIILAFLFISIQGLVNGIYFFPKFQGEINSKNIFGIILTILSFLWSIYIYSNWLKRGHLNFFILMMFSLSIGWFIYSSIDNYEIIKNIYKNKYIYQKQNIFHIYKAFKFFYWIILGHVSFFVSLAVITFVFKQIKYKL